MTGVRSSNTFPVDECVLPLSNIILASVLWSLEGGLPTLPTLPLNTPLDTASDKQRCRIREARHNEVFYIHIPLLELS